MFILNLIAIKQKRLLGQVHNKELYICIYVCIYIYIYIQSIQKKLTFVVMYLCILNIERAKNFGGNFHVKEMHKLISYLF